MKKLFTLVVLGVVAQGCRHPDAGGSVREDAAPAAAAATPDFGKLARDVFEVNCFACHKKEGPAADKFNILDFAALRQRRTKDSSAKLLVDPSAPAQSALVLRMADTSRPMPPSDLLDRAARKIVRNWIAVGAPDPGQPGTQPLPADTDPDPDPGTGQPTDPGGGGVTDNRPPATQADFDAAMAELKKSYEFPLVKGWSPKRLVDFSCGPCHSLGVKPPWFARFDVTGTIKSDMEKASAIWESGHGWPINGATTGNQVVGDMRRARKALEDGKMPPKPFLVTHPQAFLDSTFKLALIGWFGEAADKIKRATPP